MSTGDRPPSPPSPPRRGAAVVLFLTVVLLAAGGVWAGTTLWLGTPGGPSATVRDGAVPGASAGTGDGVPASGPVGDGRSVGQAFLAAWQGGDYARMQSLVADPGDDLTRAYGGLAQRLHLTAVRVVPGAYADTGPTSAVLPFQVTLTLAGYGEVSYAGAVKLVAGQAGWRVDFTSDTVHPALQLGQRLDLVAVPGPRGPVTDRAGRPLSADADLAANLVGTVGADGHGTGGLERLLDQETAGRAGQALAIVNGTTGEPVSVLQSWPGTAGASVRTTVDLGIQQAAERALAGVPGTAALVALDAGSGEVRAVVNQPTSGIPAAINGSYAPGSTFKVITATAALQAGYTAAGAVACPDAVTVGGRTIRNHEGQVASEQVSLTQAFATSCNTAFAGLASTLPVQAVHDAAALYGFDAGGPLPIASEGGKAPVPSSAAEVAEGAIGQGRIEASPLQMASVAAAVASGTWRQPHVLPCANCAAHAIPSADALRAMMRATVTSGTGTALRATPGGPVYGKTGTAEYGTGSPPATHAWFIGWQGDLAFAVFVHDGAGGAVTAAPVADRFLRLLATG